MGLKYSVKKHVETHQLLMCFVHYNDIHLRMINIQHTKLETDGG